MLFYSSRSCIYSCFIVSNHFRATRCNDDDGQQHFKTESPVVDVDSSRLHGITTPLLEERVALDTIVVSNELDVRSVPAEKHQEAVVGAPDVDVTFPTNLEAAANVACGSKRPAVLDNNTTKQS